jgi:hypothetical protein
LSDSIIAIGVTSTPSGLGLVASKLDEAIEIIKSWRIRVADSSRLPSASRLLYRSTTLSAYPDDPLQLLRIGNAIRVGFDFYHITRTLTDERVDAVAEDLRRSLSGTLDDTGPTSAQRAQSQVLFASTMAVGGLRPAAPSTAAGSSPDYVVRLGTLTFAVEMKRPESMVGIQGKMDKAIDQIAAMDSAGGVLFVDVSDCISLDSSPSSRDPDARTAFRAATTSVRDALLNSARPGRAKVTNLFVVGVWFGWREGPPRVPHPVFLTYEEVFHSARFGLLVEQAREVHERLFRGFRELGGEILERRRVT